MAGTDRPDWTSSPQQNHDVRRQLARGLVHLLKEFYGKGPTHSKAYLNDDTILILLRGGFTQVEETLLQGGERTAVMDQREAFQRVMRPKFEKMIYELTGRKVVAYISGNHQDPDVMSELFILDTTDLFEDPPPPA